MFTKRLREMLLAVALLPMLVQPVFAHVIWFDYKEGEYQLLFGHPEDGPEPYNPAKFKEATAYDKNKNVVPFSVKTQQDSLSLVSEGDVAAITAFFENGYFVRIPGSTSLNVSESEAEQYNPNYEVGRYLKYTKALYDWSDALSQPFGLPLEIQPLKNPFDLKAGEYLPVQVLYNGSLLKNPTVEYLGETLNVNSDGIAFVPYGKGGFQPIEASYTLLLDNNPYADNLSYETSFTAQKRTSVPEPSVLLGLSVLGLMGLARKQGLGLKLTKPLSAKANKSA